MSEDLDRLPNGKFDPGNRDNPGGRRKSSREVAIMFREHRDELVEIALEICRDRDYAPTARVKALELAFMYGFGRPAEQTPEFSDVDVHFTFNMRDTGLADTVEGEVIEDAELGDDAPRALPPGG